MANPSRRDDSGSTSSGQGAPGMGGDPSDDPRDLAGGHEDLTSDDRTRKVDGATSNPTAPRSDGGSSSETVGVGGDRVVTERD